MTKDNQEIRLACNPLRMIRRFWGSLGRIERGSSSVAANHCTLLRKTSPLSCSPNHLLVAKVELPMTTIFEVIFSIFLVSVGLTAGEGETRGLGEADGETEGVGLGEIAGLAWEIE